MSEVGAVQHHNEKNVEVEKARSKEDASVTLRATHSHRPSGGVYRPLLPPSCHNAHLGRVPSYIQVIYPNEELKCEFLPKVEGVNKRSFAKSCKYVPT